MTFGFLHTHKLNILNSVELVSEAFAGKPHFQSKPSRSTVHKNCSQRDKSKRTHL